MDISTRCPWCFDALVGYISLGLLLQVGNQQLLFHIHLSFVSFLSLLSPVPLSFFNCLEIAKGP